MSLLRRIEARRCAVRALGGPSASPFNARNLARIDVLFGD